MQLAQVRLPALVAIFVDFLNYLEEVDWRGHFYHRNVRPPLLEPLQGPVRAIMFRRETFTTHNVEDVVFFFRLSSSAILAPSFTCFLVMLRILMFFCLSPSSPPPMMMMFALFLCFAMLLGIAQFVVVLSAASVVFMFVLTVLVLVVLVLALFFGALAAAMVMMVVLLARRSAQAPVFVWVVITMERPVVSPRLPEHTLTFAPQRKGAFCACLDVYGRQLCIQASSVPVAVDTIEAERATDEA